MGVMACDRKGCEHIMCDILMDVGREQYYICSDCDAELQQAKNDWPRPMTVLDLQNHIHDFMKTYVGAHRVLDDCDVDQEFKKMKRYCNR